MLRSEKIKAFISSGQAGQWLPEAVSLKGAEGNGKSCAVYSFCVTDLHCLGLCDIKDMGNSTRYAIFHLLPLDRLPPWMQEKMEIFQRYSTVFDGIISGEFVAVSPERVQDSIPQMEEEAFEAEVEHVYASPDVDLDLLDE